MRLDALHTKVGSIGLSTQGNERKLRGPHLLPLSGANRFESSIFGEDEDARLTGSTRSLPRRLLALNIAGTLRPATEEKLPVREFAPVPSRELIA